MDSWKLSKCSKNAGDLCFFHGQLDCKPQMRPTLQPAEACLEDSYFSLISQSGDKPCHPGAD